MYAKKFCGTDFSIRGNELFWDHKSSKYCLIRWINGNQNLKLKTKNQNIFVGVYENLTTFLYILNRDTRKHFFRRGKRFSCPLF